MAFAVVAAGLAVGGGLAKTFMGISNAKKAKQEQRTAKRKLRARMNQYEALDTSNPYWSARISKSTNGSSTSGSKSSNGKTR